MTDLPRTARDAPMTVIDRHRLPVLIPEIDTDLWTPATRAAMALAWALSALELPCRVHHFATVTNVEVLGDPNVIVWVMRMRPSDLRFHWGNHHEQVTDPATVAGLVVASLSDDQS